MSKITKAQIADWEKKYGEVKKIVVPALKKEQKNAEGQMEEVVVLPEKVAYLRKIDRATIKYASSKLIKADQTIDTISGGEIVLNKCWLGGDPEIKDDDRYFFRACMEANTYLNETAGFI